MTQEEALRRYPRLASHMICESLGYFTPKAAANAILHHKRREPFWCEWYTHMGGLRAGCGDAVMLDVGRDVIRWSFERRNWHRGYMADYATAKRLVAESLRGRDPLFASWF